MQTQWWKSTSRFEINDAVVIGEEQKPPTSESITTASLSCKQDVRAVSQLEVGFQFVERLFNNFAWNVIISACCAAFPWELSRRCVQQLIGAATVCSQNEKFAYDYLPNLLLMSNCGEDRKRYST